jgi:hypothetical protein
MVTTRVKPRGPFYACNHARTQPRVFVDISAEDGGCYLLALDSVTYQAIFQASCYQGVRGDIKPRFPATWPILWWHVSS